MKGMKTDCNLAEYVATRSGCPMTEVTKKCLKTAENPALSAVRAGANESSFKKPMGGDAVRTLYQLL